VVDRGAPGRFDRILSKDDAERLVCATGLRMPAFRLVKEAEQIPPERYTRDVPWRPGSFSRMAVVDQVAREVDLGASVVLQALHLNWHPAAVYCRNLEAALGCPVQANAYYTPASAQGFSVHHDTHDVFILQVAGRKRWRVYEPILELPLKHQRWSPTMGDPGEPCLEISLEAGDTLYLPRGWPHEAASTDQSSLHLTIGLHPYSRLDALRAAVDGLGDDIELRRSVSSDGALPDVLMDRLAARLSPDQVAARMRRRFVATRPPIRDAQLEQVESLDSLTLDRRLERRPTVIADLELSDADATLLFEGKELVFPAKASRAVAYICATDGPFTAAELPGRLDERGRLVLSRRLIREGFVRARP
jgi:lysine-specific demethylase/histidyl-hydroxylase NO66